MSPKTAFGNKTDISTVEGLLCKGKGDKNGKIIAGGEVALIKLNPT